MYASDVHEVDSNAAVRKVIQCSSPSSDAKISIIFHFQSLIILYNDKDDINEFL